jgi:DNA-binding MarR family transcriptional regulator
MPPTLRSIIKQARPFDSLEQEASLALSRLASDLNAEQAELLRASGVTWTQYNAMRILRGASGEPLSCGEVGERMITRESDVTRLLDRLERQGLVVRARDEQDRRVVKARLTDAGLKLLAELDEPVAQMHKRQLGHLGTAKLESLLALLEEAATR